MAVLSYHPGGNATPNRGQELAIAAICNTYARLAETPLTDPVTRDKLHRKISKEKQALFMWMNREPWVK